MCRIVGVCVFLILSPSRHEKASKSVVHVRLPPYQQVFIVVSEKLVVYNVLEINSNLTGNISLASKLKTSRKEIV
jgi:hypothetical protein